MKPMPTPSHSGLTQAEAKRRMMAGQNNKIEKPLSKSTIQIIRDNCFTLFNLINVILALFVCLTRSWQNLMFMGVILCNTAVGILQEIRTKRKLDQVSVLINHPITVIREGQQQAIPPEELVLDDCVCLAAGEQIPADMIVLEGQAEVDESLLSGESQPVLHHPGDLLYSGSFLVSGSLIARASAVGVHSYASKLALQARVHKRHQAQLLTDLNKILKIIALIILPLGIGQFIKDYFFQHLPLNDAILQTAASMIGMIPEGLFFLTSISLALGVLSLIRKQTLVQELSCIETLARIDTLCLDKTGTITDGKMEVDRLIPCGKDSEEKLNWILGNLTRCQKDSNFTAEALSRHWPAQEGMRLKKWLAFSSQRKYSGAVFAEGTWLIGSYAHIDSQPDSRLLEQIHQLSAEGYRVLTLCHKEADQIQPAALILIRDKVRDDAQEIFNYFRQEGVTVKVISGDDPRTVSQAARQAGIENAGQWIDLSACRTEDLSEFAEQYTVFGRVTPQQKKELILALRSRGHHVAMTGDGVNDVLAFKAADCSIAMASGSDIACKTANLILLDSDFKALPAVLLEGRRVINNIQRSATLFLTKTLYSVMLSVLLLIFAVPYPFVPVQLSFVSIFTIGIPGFFLTLEPSYERIHGHFIKNVLIQALPGAIAVTACILVSILCRDQFAVNGDTSAFCLLAIMINGLLVLIRTAHPYTLFKRILIVFCAAGLAAGFIFFKELLMIDPLSLVMLGKMLFVITVIQIWIQGIVFWCYHHQKKAEKSVSASSSVHFQ